MLCLSPTYYYIYTTLQYCLLLKVVMPSILSLCMCVSLIMHQHSDVLTPILLSSLSLFASFFLFLFSSHRASAVLSLYLVLQRDVYNCSIPFLFPGISLYLTSSHFLQWVDMYLSVPPPICFAISLGLSMLLEIDTCICVSHIPQRQLIYINKLCCHLLWLQSRQLRTHNLLNQFLWTWNWEDEAVLLCLLIRSQCFPSLNKFK